MSEGGKPLREHDPDQAFIEREELEAEIERLRRIIRDLRAEKAK